MLQMHVVVGCLQKSSIVNSKNIYQTINCKIIGSLVALTPPMAWHPHSDGTSSLSMSRQFPVRFD